MLEQLEQDFKEADARRQVARRFLFDAAELVIDAARIVESAKLTAYDTGKIDGKNEAERKAQLTMLTMQETENLFTCERAERKARYGFEHAQAEYDLCRYRLRIAEIAAK